MLHRLLTDVQLQSSTGELMYWCNLSVIRLHYKTTCICRLNSLTEWHSLEHIPHWKPKNKSEKLILSLDLDTWKCQNVNFDKFEKLKKNYLELPENVKIATSHNSIWAKTIIFYACYFISFLFKPVSAASINRYSQPTKVKTLHPSKRIKKLLLAACH